LHTLIEGSGNLQYILVKKAANKPHVLEIFRNKNFTATGGGGKTSQGQVGGHPSTMTSLLRQMGEA